MIVRDLSIVFYISAVVLVSAIGFFASKMTGKDDSQIEETAEDFIYENTGVKIDLTPDSPEDDKKA